MEFDIIYPKFFMLNCKYISGQLTYESYLIEVLNGSRFFRSKCSFTEQYIPIKEQAHGEADAYTSTYQLDFKLLVDQLVMKSLAKNKPTVNYSTMSKGYISVSDAGRTDVVPPNNILKNILDCRFEDLLIGYYSSDTIKSLVNNLKKRKHLFLYYPYEYRHSLTCQEQVFGNILTTIFKEVMRFREYVCNDNDTYICIKTNDYFMIFEWVNDKFIFRDKVHEILCGNYLDLKTYSLY